MLQKLEKLIDLGIAAAEKYLNGDGKTYTAPDQALAAAAAGKKPAAAKKPKAAPKAKKEEKADREATNKVGTLAKAYCAQVENGEQKLQAVVKSKWKKERLIDLNPKECGELGTLLEGKLAELEEASKDDGAASL